MSPAMLAAIGFLTIILIVFLLLKDITVPALAFSGVSAATAAVLVITGTFTLQEMGGFIAAGVDGIHGTAALFVFSVLFFGVMSETGMFDKIINAMMKRVGNNVIAVAMTSCVVAMICHLDGAGASTFLITIPAMLPVYKRLKMRPTTLMLITVTAMGVMNLVPWAGPTMRTAAVLGIDANALWLRVIPMQVVGIVIALFTAFFWGNVEKKRGAGADSTLEVADSPVSAEEAATAGNLKRPQLFWFNITLTLAVVVALVIVGERLPSYVMFMLGCVIALWVNYPGSKLQNKIIKTHAGPALTMAATILGAGVFLGVLEETEIMKHMAEIIASLMPVAMASYLPLIVGVLAVPLTVLFCTDSYFLGLLPILIGVGNEFGVNPEHIAISMVVARNCATFISPVVPATFLGVGLAGVEINEHIKTCFLWLWGVSFICLAAGVVMGILTL